MSIENPGTAPLDYQLVTYPGSMVEYRGPEADLTLPNVLCLGGSETFGRFILDPFPKLLAHALQRPVVNLGAINAGLDLMLKDPVISMALTCADKVVLQITGTHTMTNRFYRVHPRRNDRFLRASPALETIYRNTDFTDFHFVRHMLGVLQETSPDRFAIVVRELQEAWVARMISFLDRIDVPVHLLWFAVNPPSDGIGDWETNADPLFVTHEMLEKLANVADSLTYITATEEERENPTKGMFFGPREAPAARVLPNSRQHDRAAAELSSLLSA